LSATLFIIITTDKDFEKRYFKSIFLPDSYHEAFKNTIKMVNIVPSILLREISHHIQTEIPNTRELRLYLIESET
jgi:hypothetical protein